VHSASCHRPSCRSPRQLHSVPHAHRASGVCGCARGVPCRRARASGGAYPTPLGSSSAGRTPATRESRRTRGPGACPPLRLRWGPRGRLVPPTLVLASSAVQLLRSRVGTPPSSHAYQQRRTWTTSFHSCTFAQDPPLDTFCLVVLRVDEVGCLSGGFRGEASWGASKQRNVARWHAHGRCVGTSGALSCTIVTILTRSACSLSFRLL
jgi:hypothetical protein